MNNSAKLSLLAVLTACLLPSTSVLAQDAQARPPLKPPVMRLTHLPPAAVKHAGQGVYINTGNVGTTVAGGTYTAVDAPITVLCPGTTGTCLLQADEWLQTGQGSTAGNEFALCFYVDGSSIGSCWYNGSTPADGTYVMGSTSAGKTVTHGSHTVQTFVYSANGAYLSYYNNTYRVYKP